MIPSDPNVKDLESSDLPAALRDSQRTPLVGSAPRICSGYKSAEGIDDKGVASPLHERARNCLKGKGLDEHTILSQLFESTAWRGSIVDQTEGNRLKFPETT